MDQQVIVIKAASQWIAPGAGVVSQLVGNVHSHILHFIYTFSPRNASNTTTNRGRRFSSHRSSSTKDYNLYGLYYTFVCLRNCINVLRYAWQGVQSPFQHHTSSRQGYHALHASLGSVHWHLPGSRTKLSITDALSDAVHSIWKRLLRRE